MRLEITGPTKLKGTVNLQGAKNAACRHIILPLLTDGIFTISNIPHITTVTSLLDIFTAFMVRFKWQNKNTLQFDTTKGFSPITIPGNLYFHSSAAILLVPVLVHRFGKCEIELDVSKNQNRDDWGGDTLGRKIIGVNKTLEICGIKSEQTDNKISYHLINDRPLNLRLPFKSTTVTYLLLVSALYREGTSVITNTSQIAEIDDFINYTNKAGANIVRNKDKITIEGKAKLKSTDYENMYDKHDFITFLSSALCTESEIKIQNVDYNKMKLSSLDEFLKQTEVDITFDKKNHICKVNKNLISKLKPVDLLAEEYPNFVTEWQVLLSPLFAMIPGASKIVEGFFPNRLRHWEQLANAGAKYKFFTHPDYPEDDNNPRAVEISGGIKFESANYSPTDVRTGAAFLTAALAANGTSTIDDPDNHIKRGYEELPERLIKLGAKIKIIDR